MFSFAQAQERARVYFARKARELAGLGEEVIEASWTVATALTDYLAARERRGSKGVRADRYAAEARILPALGALELTALTTKHIREWHHDLAEAAKLRRTASGAETDVWPWLMRRIRRLCGRGARQPTAC